jgi:hypothetical protein
MMKKDTESIKCNECSEFISFEKTDNLGKCLRDSMYKDSENNSCQFANKKAQKANLFGM